MAWFHFNNSDAGVPTILLLPKTTAWAPAKVIPERFISSMTPFGVQGKKPDKSPTATRPSLIVFKLEKHDDETTEKRIFATYPSTSFSGETLSVIKCESMTFSESNGICTMIPWTFGSLLSLWSLLKSWNFSLRKNYLNEIFYLPRIRLWIAVTERAWPLFQSAMRLLFSYECKHWSLPYHRLVQSLGPVESLEVSLAVPLSDFATDCEFHYNQIRVVFTVTEI